MAKVSRTSATGADAGEMEYHDIPDLMTRVKLEHELESLLRDGQKQKNNLKKIRAKSKTLGRDPLKALVDDFKKEIARIAKRTEEVNKEIDDLNERVSA